jgi:hypothetical protein
LFRANIRFNVVATEMQIERIMLSLEKKKKQECVSKLRGMPGGQRKNSEVEGGGTAVAEDLVLKGDAG